MEATDHDKLITLVANVKTLTESQEAFHAEMRNAMKELKDNYSGRLDDHEKRLGNLEATRTDFRTKIEDIRSTTDIKLDNLGTWLKWFCAIGLILIGIMSYHLTGANFL